MSKCTEIREFCGDYAFEVEYSEDNKFTMFFNSRRNAETVKRCIEVDDSVPNVATAVDFVEVVRCKDCEHYRYYGKTSLLADGKNITCGWCMRRTRQDEEYRMLPTDFCSYGERKEQK